MNLYVVLISDKTQASNCEPDIFEKGQYGIHYTHTDTQTYYIPKHIKYK